MGLGVIWSELDGIFISHLGFIDLSCLVQRITQVDMDFDVPGARLQRLPVILNGLLEPALLLQGDARVVGGICMAGLQRQSLTIGLERSIKLKHLKQNSAAVVVPIGMTRGKHQQLIVDCQ